MPTNLKKFEENRKRKNRHTVRFTDDEEKTIQKRMNDAGYTSLTAFIADIASNGFIFIQNVDALVELSTAINKVGVNINQIAHRVNERNSINKDEVNKLEKDLNEIRKMVTNFIKNENRKSGKRNSNN